MEQAGSLLRAFAFDGVGDVEHFVHPCVQVPNRRSSRSMVEVAMLPIMQQKSEAQLC
jgi:hypothetical protein